MNEKQELLTKIIERAKKYWEAGFQNVPARWVCTRKEFEELIKNQSDKNE